MATIAAALPRGTGVRWRRYTTGVLFVLPAVLYAVMRLGVAREAHAGMTRFCASIPLEPHDWPCRLSAATTIATYVIGSLLVGAAIALPGVLLARSGRGVVSAVPVTLAGLASAATVAFGASRPANGAPFGIAELVFGSGDSASFWARHTLSAVVADGALAATPALAIALVLRPARRAVTSVRRRDAAWVATFAVVGVIVALKLVFARASSEYFAAPVGVDWVTTAMMGLFAAMLGTDRRWWPWALAPVAVLLSLGPSVAVMSIPWDFTVLTWFRGVAPLLLVGLVASMWRPLSLRLAGEREPPTADPQDGRRGAGPGQPRVRGVVVANALAVSLVATSLFAARYDPLPIQISTALPTFLGVRELAQDVRAQENLVLALGAAASYRASHGTFVGFDVTTGEALAPELEWTERAGGDLAVAVTATGPRLVQLVTTSSRGAAFCAQVAERRTTMGRGEPAPGAPARAIRDARMACGAEPFSAATIPIVHVESLCDGVDDSAILLCRSVQKVVRETLSSPTV